MSGTRARILAACALACATVAPAAAQTPSKLDAIAAQAERAHTLVAGQVIDATTGTVLYARNPQTFMLGASTTKLVTVGMALATLGPDFRITTPVYRLGHLDAGGTLHGDLVLVGAGDANLSGRLRPDGTLAFANEDHSYDGTPDTQAVSGDPLLVLRELATQVRTSGIRAITGSVQADASLINGGMEGGTGAAVSSVVVNDNLIDVTITPSARGGTPSFSVSPQTPYARFTMRATTGAAGSRRTISLDDHRNADGSETVTISGSIPEGKPLLYAYRVPDPATFAQMAFAMVLRDAGVRIQGVTPRAALDPHAYVAANLVASHLSPPLAQDAYVTLKVSDNLHADLMPYLCAIYGLHHPSDPLRTAFSAERTWLAQAGLDVGAAALQDGLGSDAYFTPAFMTAYLKYVNERPWFAAFEHALPILGVDGTLFNIQNGAPAAGKVFAKTGTWSSYDALNDRTMVSAKGLAGYTTTRSGHRVIFAFYVNRFADSADRDVAHEAGEIEGSLANAVYESL